MNIQVTSRNKAIEYTYKQHGFNYFMISISDSFEENPQFNQTHKFNDMPECLGICYLNFDDVEKGEPNCITEDDVEYLEMYLANFFKRHPEVDDIIVHCGAGVSRSAGMAAALMKFYNNDDFPIFNNPKYCPNMTVYRMVLERLIGDINNEEIKTKEEKNIALWKVYHGLE